MTQHVTLAASSSPLSRGRRVIVDVDKKHTQEEEEEADGYTPPPLHGRRGGGLNRRETFSLFLCATTRKYAKMFRLLTSFSLKEVEERWPAGIAACVTFANSQWELTTLTLIPVKVTHLHLRICSKRNHSFSYLSIATLRHLWMQSVGWPWTWPSFKVTSSSDLNGHSILNSAWIKWNGTKWNNAILWR